MEVKLPNNRWWRAGQAECGRFGETWTSAGGGLGFEPCCWDNRFLNYRLDQLIEMIMAQLLGSGLRVPLAHRSKKRSADSLPSIVERRRVQIVADAHHFSRGPGVIFFKK